jgi:uncharacterized membrane protein YgcG
MILRFFTISTVVLMSFMSFAQDMPLQSPPSPILDEVGLLSSEEKLNLENTLKTIKYDTRHEIGIAIISSLEGKSLEQRSRSIALAW